jgi:anti-anti-sigma factor
MDYETADIAVRDVDGVTIARLRNANLTGVMEIQRIGHEIAEIIDRPVRKLILDFKYVRFAGSAALGMLIMVQKKMEKAGGMLVLSHSENIEELLKVSRTSNLFKLAADPKAAFKMFT